MFPNNSYGHMHVSVEGTLQLSGAQKDDAGYYVCSAFSVVDSTTIRAFLQVSDENFTTDIFFLTYIYAYTYLYPLHKSAW